MGLLQNGKWVDKWYDTKESKGAFKRQDSKFRNTISTDSDNPYQPEAGRYHLYVSLACPWAHRTLIFRALKGLESLIDVTVVQAQMLENGWEFDDEKDPLYGFKYAYELYLKSDPSYEGRVTVPILWDTKTQTIVNNESAEIIRIFNTAFNDLTGNTDDYSPEALLPEIDQMNARIYDTINNGVYKAGFATTQDAYNIAYDALFESLDWLEDHLSKNRYLVGEQITEADWRLLTTLVRFDPVYHLHFKCNRHRIIDYPNLWAYTRELHQWPGVAETVNLEHIVRHYHYSHETINPNRIIPINPVLDFDAPHGRNRRVAA